MFSYWPKYTQTEIKNVSKILRSGKVTYWTGDYCKIFEKKYASYHNMKYGIAVANGSVGLDCALRSLNLSSNDEVIVGAKSYIASAHCVVNAGAKVIFADVDLNSQNINLDTIKKKITKKTKAIICVHLGGYPCQMDEIIKFAKKKKIFVIEDCSQAHGAKIKKKLVGSFGDISVWSFCNDKIISTGEGGMILTNNKKLWKKMWSLKDCGKNYDSIFIKKNKTDLFQWVHDNNGTNLRLTEMQAAIGINQLKYLKSRVEKRNKNCFKIWNSIKEFKSVIIPKIQKNFFHAGYRCYFLINKKKLKKNWSRNKIIFEMRKNNVPCFQGSCSEMYLEKFYKKSFFLKNERYKNAKILSENSIALLVDHTISIKKINFMIKKLRQILYFATI